LAIASRKADLDVEVASVSNSGGAQLTGAIAGQFGHLALEAGGAFGSEGGNQTGFRLSRLGITGKDDEAIATNGGRSHDKDKGIG
jgi:hypothetical protein